MEVGLVNWAGGYLTAERYGDGVSVLGSSLGKNQTWLVEEAAAAAPESESESESTGTEVWLEGPWGGRRLVAEADGAVRCAESTESAEAEGAAWRFVLEVHASGAWSLRRPEGRYLESDGEDVFCVSRAPRGAPPPRHLWMPRLAGHPHAALFHPRRRRFAREDPELGRVWVDARRPDGPHASFLFLPLLRRSHGHGKEEEEDEEDEEDRGGWRVETAGRRFLSAERLAARTSPDTAVQLSLRPGGRVSLADRRGRLLYPQGPRGLLRPGHDPRDGEEWFLLRRCPPAVTLSDRRGRFLAVLRDGRVYAGSKEPTPASSFLLEFGPDGRTVQLRGPRRKYLAQRPSGSVRADGGARDPETRFSPLWIDGKLFLRASDGRFLGTGAAPLPGLVVARAPRPGPSEELGLRLANRSFLVLRGREGFVGSSGDDDDDNDGGGGGVEGVLLVLLRGDRLEPDRVDLLPCEKGVYHLRSRGKGFWSLTPERTVHPWGKVALNFRLEIRGRSLLAILAPNGRYLRGGREGPLVADREEACRECLWEF